MDKILKPWISVVIVIGGFILFAHLLPWLIIGMLLMWGYAKIRQYFAFRPVQKSHKEKSGRIIDVEYTEIK